MKTKTLFRTWIDTTRHSKSQIENNLQLAVNKLLGEGKAQISINMMDETKIDLTVWRSLADPSPNDSIRHNYMRDSDTCLVFGPVGLYPWANAGFIYHEPVDSVLLSHGMDKRYELEYDEFIDHFTLVLSRK